MGTTKKEVFTEDTNETAELFKALGHPARMAIVEILLRKSTCVCGELVEELPLAQATVSQHLKELKKVGIIKGSIEGTSICYCLNPDTLQRLQQKLSQLIEHSQLTSSCCNT